MSNKNVFTTVENKVPNRNYFDLTHDMKFSCKFGELVPVCAMEALPGDKFRIGAESLIRFQPLTTPAMHRFDVTIHYFFVPNRILWPNWEKFIAPETGIATHAHPTVPMENNPVPRISDFFGIPNNGGINGTDPVVIVNALPFAAYWKIWSDYYRDQNLMKTYWDEFIPLSDGLNHSAYANIRYRCFEHDYFTSALPFAQKGESVSIPLGEVELKRGPDNQTPVTYGAWVKTADGLDADGDLQVQGGISEAGGAQVVYDPNGTLQVGSTTINELRRAYALQEWLEKNARGGTRYTEVIRMHFGTISSDARLQRAEYITGVKSPIIISEVLNTTGADGGLPQGNMAGHGVGTLSGGGKSYYCEEHGWIMGIMSVMPKTAYQQGLHKKFTRTSPLDYYWPSFAHIGEQEILNQEVYLDPKVPIGEGWNAQPFGYIPRYSEYRFEQNRVSTDLRTTLKDWHAGRIFDTENGTNMPALNAQFVSTQNSADETTDRLFAVQSDEADPLICVVLNKIHAIRPLPYFGTPSY